MTIVNQTNIEDDPENWDEASWKTIDLETGAYLQLVDEHAFSSYYGYILYDGDTVYKISTHRRTENYTIGASVAENANATEVHRIDCIFKKEVNDAKFHTVYNIADIHKRIESFFLVFKGRYGGAEDMQYRVDFIGYDKDFNKIGRG